ncbi:MAG: TonB-dependent receptor [Prolixibacteraceae bacterium]|nr:TonB-dependent receptor [Prolixibacteraceae bacterium]MBN2775636.1 TonB-dependent receptor [Prolixibacteraceae bacterium]
MKKVNILLFFMVCLHFAIFSQEKFTLSGKITDENSHGLEGATVVVLPSGEGAIANTKGQYLLSAFVKGLYTVKVTFVGYKTLIDTISISDNYIFNAQLQPATLSLQEVVVSDHYAETRQKEMPLNVEVVNDDFLKQNRGGSLMKSLERLPGISTIDIGSGQSKPVIRGLGFNRVVVVENGIKHEGQQWGADHGLEIDQYAVEKLEIVKGPASLLYGSDAVGGVIDIKQNGIPAENTVSGVVDLNGKTNNNLLGTSISVAARKKSFFAGMRATFLDYADYKVPTESVDIYSYKAALYKNHLRNTAGNEQNLHLFFGVIQKYFQSKFFVSRIFSKSGLFANAHGLEPRNVDTGLHDKSSRDIQFPSQQVNHIKVINKSEWFWDKFSIEAELGFQRNFRQEWSQYVSHGYMPPVFPDSLNFDPELERQFEKYIYSGNLRGALQVNSKLSLSAGISSEFQDNRIGGRGFIIPAFKQYNSGSYALAKHLFSEESILQFGLRFDFGKINSKSYYDWFPSSNGDSGEATEYLKRSDDLSRTFTNLSWSLGYNYSPENWLFKINFGKSFRMPIAKELESNGVNYHRFSYEVGDSKLLPEVSYQFDAGLEYHATKLAVGATPFVNYFSNYIYLNPTDRFDRLYGAGNQIFEYTQSKVFRFGGEIHAHYQLVKSLQFGFIGEYVYSEQLSGSKKGFTLPFSPPASAIANLKYQKARWGFAKDVYISLDYRLTASQNKIVPPEKSTNGFQVVNLSAGAKFKLNSQELILTAQVQNLFNTKYFNHTSYYRLINVPEPGRNFILNISVPFTGKI